jgi:8-amino-7-oxononanoate synthase
MDLETHLREQLAVAEQHDLLRVPPTYEARGTSLQTADSSLVSFASNDYLGLSENPALQLALADGALQRAGAGSSRVVTGTSPAHRAAESTLADLTGLPSARVFPSAYAANLGLLGSLFGREDLLVSDELNHASLIDGCRLSRAQVRVYRHGDFDHLRAILRHERPRARIAAVVTETAFSMDGDIADVALLRDIANEHTAAMVVDEAHALGVVGTEGRGVCAQAGVRPDVLVGGLGKSFGLGGGFLAGSPNLARAIDNFARTFVFSTALLPAVAHAIPVSVDLLRAASHERALLTRYADQIRAAVRATGAVVLGQSPSAILPIVLGASQHALVISAELRQRGLLVPAMRPPTVPVGTARLRVTPTALHTPTEIEALTSALRDVLTSPGHRNHGDQRDHA